MVVEVDKPEQIAIDDDENKNEIQKLSVGTKKIFDLVNEIANITNE